VWTPTSLKRTSPKKRGVGAAARQSPPFFRLRSSSLSEKAFYGIARFIDELRGRVSIQNCSGRADFQGRICPRAEFLEKEVKKK